MGSLTGTRGVWAYVRGGMGALSEAIAEAALAAGVSIRTEICASALHTNNGQMQGVALEDGTELPANTVVSSLDPTSTFELLQDQSALPDEFARSVRALDYRSPVVKINLALTSAPRFRVSDRDEIPLSGTIHLGANDLDALEDAYTDASRGEVSRRPIVELTLPSSLDPSLAPDGHYVASIFWR